MGITLEEVSRLLGGSSQEYPLMRLLGFLTAFGQDVEINLRPHSRAGDGGWIIFTVATS